jgi:DNA polymerase-4
MDGQARGIIHLDLDAFYAAVEVLDDPSLRGLPVIVGGGRERGVVSSASYEARRFGVHSAQPIAQAMRLCPRGVFLPVRMARYAAMSEEVFGIFRQYTPLVEPLSIDEAFLDVTGSGRLFGTPDRIAAEIKERVREETGLTVSAGVATNKFVAKIASDLKKPDGLVIVEPGKVLSFLDGLPVRRMWGVGPKTLESLERMGVRTIGDLRRIPRGRLVGRFGKAGLRMSLLAGGEDDRGVEPDRDTKSLGSEETFGTDIRDQETARREILALADRVARRLRRYGLSGRTVTLKIKYEDFRQITRSETLAHATDDEWEICGVCRGLLEQTPITEKAVRLLGISLSHFVFQGEEAQISLFHHEARRRKRRELNRALDRVSERFGEGTIAPAAIMDRGLGRGREKS